MKRLFFVILTVLAVISLSFPIFAAEDKPASKIIVYYFHGTSRCYTCTNMEKYSREAIEENFKEALSSGNLEFKSVNVEDRGNEHFVDDYQIYTKTLILSLVKDTNQVRYKNLDKIWKLAGDKKKFISYVTSEINSFMKDAQ